MSWLCVIEKCTISIITFYAKRRTYDFLSFFRIFPFFFDFKRYIIHSLKFNWPMDWPIAFRFYPKIALKTQLTNRLLIFSCTFIRTLPKRKNPRNTHNHKLFRGWLQKKRDTFWSISLAGLPGFEPGNDGVRVRCLTVWR